jgi:triphosphoribosyl-dephospho-CoA synthase
MKNTAWTLASIGQLSILLEASSPKPGNVNRLFRFSDTGYRHFLASAALVNRGLYHAASRGIDLAEKAIEPQNVGLGHIILESARDVFTGINKRNTIFGSLLLYIPLLVSLGATIRENGSFSQKKVKHWLKIILNNTTMQDTIDAYKAFHVINPEGQTNKDEARWTEFHDRYDIDNPHVYENIKEDGTNLQDLFRLSADVDVICKEWSEYFTITLDEVFPHLDKLAKSLEDFEEGVVKTFIWLLSRYPDGLIVKKAGPERAEEVRTLASRIIEEGFEHLETKAILERLDRELRKEGNLLNPGTTADLVSAAILCKLASIIYPKL